MGAPTNTTLGVCHWSHPRASRGRGAAGRPHCGPLGVGSLASLFPLQLPNPMSSKRGGTEGKRLARWGRPWRGARAQPWRDGRMGCERRVGGINDKRYSIVIRTTGTAAHLTAHTALCHRHISEDRRTTNVASAKAGRQKIEERTCGFTFLSFGRERPHTHIQTHTKTRLGASPLSTDTRRRVQNGNSASPTAAPTVALQVCLWRAGNARCPSPWSKPSSTVTHLPRSIRTVRGLAAASRSQCRAALGRQGPGRGRAARDGVCVVCARVVMALRRGATVRGSVMVAHTLVS